MDNASAVTDQFSTRDIHLNISALNAMSLIFWQNKKKKYFSFRESQITRNIHLCMMIKISRESFSALVNLNSERHESPLENSVTIFNEFSFPLTEPRIITIATNLTSILDLLLRSSSPVAMTQDQRRWNRRFPLLSPPRSKPWTRGQRRLAAPPSFLPQLAPNWSILFCGSFLIL